jgi:hypothetical protein
MLIESWQLLGRGTRSRRAGYGTGGISVYIIGQWSSDLLKVFTGSSTDRFAGWLTEFGEQEDEEAERDRYSREHRQDRQN